MKFGILEVGSTNTKAFIYEDGNLTNYGVRHIAWKTHYKEVGHLLESDIETLFSFMEEVKEQVGEIHAVGTSIFRNLQAKEKEFFLERVTEKFGPCFRIVSPEEERYYTVQGVIGQLDYNGKIAVVIGGGGSTEYALVDGKKIVQKQNFDFGAMDITEAFPELKEDRVTTSFDSIFTYTDHLLGDFSSQADLLVLAGGDYLYFYETLGYEMEKNTFYQDVNQPYMISKEKFDFYDHDVLTQSLESIKQKEGSMAGWWDGARGMRFCMNAIAKKIHANYIIPTRINMLIGLISEIVTQK